MKTRLLVALAIMSFASRFVSAEEPKTEEWKFESISVSSGDSPIASGITAGVTVAKGRLQVEAAFQHEQAWINFGAKLGKIGTKKTDTSFRGYAGGSIGYFQGVPWAGPILSLKKPFSKDVSVSMLQWPGVYFWDLPSRKSRPPNKEWAPIGYVMVYQLDIGPVGLFYGGLDYLDDPWNDLPGVSIKKKFQKEFTLSVSATRNTNKREWMFFIGAAWEP